MPSQPDTRRKPHHNGTDITRNTYLQTFDLYSELGKGLLELLHREPCDNDVRALPGEGSAKAFVERRKAFISDDRRQAMSHTGIIPISLRHETSFGDVNRVREC